MLYLAEAHVPQIWDYLIRRKVERLLRLRLAPPRLLLRLRGRLRLSLDLDIAGQRDEFPEGVGDLGLEVLIILHFGEVMLQVEQDAVEFGLICLLASVKFNYPTLEDGDEVHYEAVVGLLLLAGGEARVDRHFIYINYYYTSSLKLLQGDAKAWRQWEKDGV